MSVTGPFERIIGCYACRDAPDAFMEAESAKDQVSAALKENQQKQQF